MVVRIQNGAILLRDQAVATSSGCCCGQCAPGETQCGAECCTQTETCCNGNCCTQEQTCCSGSCCDNVCCEGVCCPPGEACVGGECKDAGDCPADRIRCDGDCCPAGFICCCEEGDPVAGDDDPYGGLVGCECQDTPCAKGSSCDADRDCPGDWCGVGSIDPTDPDSPCFGFDCTDYLFSSCAAAEAFAQSLIDAGCGTVSTFPIARQCCTTAEGSWYCWPSASDSGGCYVPELICAD